MRQYAEDLERLKRRFDPVPDDPITFVIQIYGGDGAAEPNEIIIRGTPKTPEPLRTVKIKRKLRAKR